MRVLDVHRRFEGFVSLLDPLSHGVKVPQSSYS